VTENRLPIGKGRRVGWGYFSIFLDFPWDTNGLAFHQTERAVNTPSTWQVRQPSYASSVGRWRNYERHLGSLLTVLAETATHSHHNP
jgi:hypothetical protein